MLIDKLLRHRRLEVERLAQEGHQRQKVLQAVRLMGKCYLPKPLAAALIIMVMLALAGAGISLLYEPAAQWLERLPLLGSRLAEQVEDVTASIDVLKDSVAPGKSATESIKGGKQRYYAVTVRVGTNHSDYAVSACCCGDVYLLLSGIW